MYELNDFIEHRELGILNTSGQSHQNGHERSLELETAELSAAHFFVPRHW